MKNKVFYIICILHSVCIPLFSTDYTVFKLLSGYIENDITLQKLTSSVKYSQLQSDISDISDGWSFTLETGTVSVITGENSKVTLTPSASLSLPNANNFTVNLETSLTYSDSKVSVQDSSLSFNTDIISSTSLVHKITKLKNERNILEAKRNLQNGFVESEKNFYSGLNSLYSKAVSLITSQLTLYEDQISLEELKASGYSESSSKYRTAKLTVLSDQYQVQEYQHELERQTKIFADKCGIDYQGDEVMTFLPSDIPSVKAINITDFNRECYTSIESARWTHYINTLSRQSSSIIGLNLTTGYTKDNSTTDTDTLDAGSTFSVNSTGLILQGGISVPVFTDSFSPVYTFGISFDPNELRTIPLNRKVNRIESDQEELDIKDAMSDYETSVIEKTTSLSDLMWQKESDNEYYTMYKQMEEDYKKYFDLGIISESEYKQSQANRQKYEIEIIINKIDFLIYNAETKLLFTRDEEIL